MEQPSPERLREIYDEHGGDVARVASTLGIPLHELPNVSPLVPVHHYRRRTPPADLGHEPIRQYIVSRRHAEHPLWPKEDENKIDDARADYEAGTHEMCQGRDRNWFVLYSIPRKKRAGARKFFRTYE